MKSNGIKTIIIAVSFITLLIVGSGAQASSLFALDGNPAPAERQIGLFQQAIQWLGGAWGDLASVFASSEKTPQPPPPQCTVDCGDAGSGIDPLG